MERRWWISAGAALALMAVPALADEPAKEKEPAPAPGVQAAPAAEPAAAAPAAEAAAADTAAPDSAPAAPATKVAEGGGAAPAAPAAKAEEKKEEPKPAPKFTFGGSADFYFSTNFNDPFTGKNALRAFDIKDEHGPHLGLIDIWAQYARDPVGFRLDLDWGPTAKLVNAFEPTRDDIWEHIQQVYIGVNLNKKGTDYVEFGKWVTTAGVEVIEPKDNWLYNRGLLFNLAIPFYHMGGRYYHYFNDSDYVMGAVQRGWNAVSSPGHDVGFAIAGSKKLSDEWTFIGNYYGGEESPTFGAGKSYRNLFDLIANYNPKNSKWAYTLNADIDTQGNTSLFGFSGQAKYQIDPKSYATFRGEFLLDDNFIGTNVYSATLGYAYVFNKYFQTRAEFRYDWAQEDVFAGSSRGVFKGNQGTFLISAIVSY